MDGNASTGPVEPNGIYNAREAGEFLRLTERTVRQMVKDGRLSAGKRRKGDAIRIPGQVILDYLGVKPPEVKPIESEQARKKRAAASAARAKKALGIK